MSLHVLACFLIVCVSFDASAGPIDEARRLQEIQKLPTGLGVYDDDGKLCTITNKQSEEKEITGTIKFNLYTKQNPTIGHELQTTNPSSLSSSYFDANKETYIVTHGWRNTGNSLACTLIRDAILANTDSNVIVVDWSVYSMTINYIDASYKVKRTGLKVSEMINLLYSNGLKSGNLSLIGHSLGAHVMGIAGYNTSPKVKQIIGLDPALPMFNFAKAGEALSREDAENVQIIHTNAGALGYVCPGGHSDFFPNGGVRQAGCCKGINIAECAACSHGRAYMFFAESIAKPFNATRCESYAKFESKVCAVRAYIARMGGLNLHDVSPGTYYLTTSDKEPYSEPPRNLSLADVTPFFANAVCNAVELTVIGTKVVKNSVGAVINQGKDLLKG